MIIGVSLLASSHFLPFTRFTFRFRPTPRFERGDFQLESVATASALCTAGLATSVFSLPPIRAKCPFVGQHRTFAHDNSERLLLLVHSFTFPGGG
jgi:hypothetical protein